MRESTVAGRVIGVRRKWDVDGIMCIMVFLIGGGVIGRGWGPEGTVCLGPWVVVHGW